MTTVEPDVVQIATTALRDALDARILEARDAIAVDDFDRAATLLTESAEQAIVHRDLVARLRDAVDRFVPEPAAESGTADTAAGAAGTATGDSTEVTP